MLPGVLFIGLTNGHHKIEFRARYHKLGWSKILDVNSREVCRPSRENFILGSPVRLWREKSYEI